MIHTGFNFFMRLRLSWVFALLPLLAGGCGDSTGAGSQVAGTVSIDGEPVEKGLISFSPRESGIGRPATADIVDGRYEAKEVPIGNVLVQIHATKETGKMVADQDGGGEYAEILDLVPEKYRSGIETTISGQDDSHDFDLTPR